MPYAAVSSVDGTHLCCAQAAEQELELPEDMALDDDGLGNADEAGEEGADAGEAEGDEPQTFPEPRDAGADDGDGTEEANQDADMADPADAQDGAHAQPPHAALSAEA